MNCIAALDYNHLGDGRFLLTLAQSFSSCPHFHPLFIHGNSVNTERIIQQGVMRSEAEIRDIKTLNHRLVNLFADEGVAALGIHGFQKKAITYKNNQLAINRPFFDKLPSVSIFLSTLIWNEETESYMRAELSHLVTFLREALPIGSVYSFSLKEGTGEDTFKETGELKWDCLSERFSEQYIPVEFRDYGQPLRLISAKSVGDKERNKRSISIR